jgi:hypothetical protein
MFNNQSGTTMKFSLLWNSVLLAAVAAVGISGCSDDTVAPDPNAGKTSAITIFHAVPDYTTPVVVRASNTVISNSLAYGAPTTAQAQIGSGTTVSVKSSAGTDLGSTGLQIDSTRSVWVLFAGLFTGSGAQKSTVFGFSDPKPTVSATKALVRLIHASPNAPSVSLRIGDSTGADLATNISYKNKSDFKSVDTTNKTLVVTKETGNTQLLSLPVTLVAGKVYTVIVYGSADVAAVDPYKLAAKIVAEP